MPSPTLNPQPQGTEIAFVTGIQKDLMARFPTAADAIKAGYFRFGNEDSDGAISYANLQWQSADPQHPSQLWYDVKGNLLGADFSVLQSSSMEPPKLWGVDFRRWTSFREHIHYILVGPNGTETYGGMSAKKFVAAGGSVNRSRAPQRSSRPAKPPHRPGEARVSIPVDLGSHRLGQTQPERRLRR